MARYFSSVRQPYVSQFVAEPLDFYQGKFDDMQKKQDAYKLQVAGLNKQTNALVNDIPGAVEDKKRIESQLEELGSINYNDPIQQQKAVKGMLDIRNAFDKFGVLGARDDKKIRYDLAQKQIEEDKNDFKKSYRLAELKKLNLSPEKAIQFDEKGRPLNTEIEVPEDWEYKDKTKWMSDTLKDVFADTRSVNSGLTEDKAHQAILSYMNGNIEERTGKKIYDSLKARALSDPNLMKSIKAEALVYGVDPEVLFETALSGTVTGGQYKKSNLDNKYMTDRLALKKASDEIDAGSLKFTTETGATESAGSWTKIAGLDKHFDEDGLVKTANTFNYDAKVYNTLTKKEEIKKIRSAEDYNNLVNNKNLQVVENKPSSEPNKNLQRDTENALTELYKKTSALGLNVTRDRDEYDSNGKLIGKKGSINGSATKENAINYFKGLSVYSNYTVPFQNPVLVKAISNDMFGKISNIHNMEIYEQGNPDSKSKYEGADKKAQFAGSEAIGLDFTASKPGAMKIVAPAVEKGFFSDSKADYGDTPFIAISRNKTLQDQMKPVQELTYKALQGAKDGKVDKDAQTLTNYLKGTVVTDNQGKSINLEQLGIPVSASRDLDGTYRVAYLDNSTGTPMIQVLEKKSGGATSIKSLDEVQQDKTGEIFNTGGALSQFQKLTTKTTEPSVIYEEGEDNQ